MDLNIKDQLRMMAKNDLGRELTDAEAEHLFNIYQGKIAGSMENPMTTPALPNIPSNLKAPEDTGEPVFDEPQPAVDPEEVMAENAKTQDRQMTGLKLGSAALIPPLLSQTSGKTAMQVAGLPFEAAKGIGSQVIQNAPALAYGTAVARQLKENLSDPKMAETAQGEFADAQKAGTAAGYLNFPKTAEMGAEKIASAVVPTEATNLIGTLAKALTGTARGGLKAVSNVMGAVKPVGEATKGFLTDPATAPAAKMIAALVGASDKSTEGEAIARLLGAPAGTVKSVTSDATGLMGLFDKPYSELTADQKEFVKSNFDTYMKYRGMVGGAAFDKDIFKVQQDLRKDFETAAKPYRDSAQSFQKLQNVYKNMASGQIPTKAQTLTLGYNFMKTLDPNSTVRESEFGMLGNLGMLPGPVQAFYNEVVRGGAQFTKEMADDMMLRAQEAFKATQDQHNQLVSYYSEQAVKIPNTKPEDIVVNYGFGSGINVPKPKEDTRSESEKLGLNPPKEEKPKEEKPKASVKLSPEDQKEFAKLSDMLKQGKFKENDGSNKAKLYAELKNKSRGK